MTKGTLDLPGSRELIAGLVADYEAALDASAEGCSRARFIIAREKLDRWLWPLARWYLDHSVTDGT
ncbi:MAG: hypothetical protein IJ233_03515 [Pyramidobacter sp.]|nr:hypothetical protein [Pyramidobacter sp.]MBQ8129378.1 hypothetical protein [Clostridia bacterium]